MQASCEACGARYNLNDDQIAPHPRVQFRCTKCGKMTILDLRKPERTQPVSPLPDFARGPGGGFHASGTLLSTSSGLSLPVDQTITLSVISGASKGLSEALAKPRTVIGRKGGGGDLELDDPEVSRWHCVVEVKSDIVHLRDLDSTNGTFVEGERVRAAELQHLSEFRVGSTLVLVTITRKQD